MNISFMKRIRTSKDAERELEEQAAIRELILESLPTQRTGDHERIETTELEARLARAARRED